MHFLQGIAGTLELFHRSTLAFQKVAGEVTGQQVAVHTRILPKINSCTEDPVFWPATPWKDISISCAPLA
jgi:hypothetical protein